EPLHAAGILSTAAGHHVPVRRVRTTVQPVSARRGTVVLEGAERWQLLTGGQVLAVDLPRHLILRGGQRIGVGPVEGEDRIGKHAALVPVQLAHLREDAPDDVPVSKFSATTSHFSCDRAKTIFRELGPLQTGFIPKSTRPST